MKKLLFVAVLVALWHHFYYIGTREVLSDADLAAYAPYKTQERGEVFHLADMKITPIADFEVEARVLDAERYYFDRKGQIAPLQLIIGWGPMAKPDIYNNVDFSILDHQYKWDIATPDQITEQEVALNILGLHLIPGNEDVRRKFNDIKIGDVIFLKGKLVHTQSATGWDWKSSVKKGRGDKNSGDIIYTTTLNIILPGTQFTY